MLIKIEVSYIYDRFDVTIKILSLLAISLVIQFNVSAKRMG